MEELAFVWVAAVSGLIDLAIALGTLWACVKPIKNGGRRLGIRGVLIAMGVRRSFLG